MEKPPAAFDFECLEAASGFSTLNLLRSQQLLVLGKNLRFFFLCAETLTENARLGNTGQNLMQEQDF